MDSLVSIITPCYNGESYVGRFLDSILAQTYPNIEMIIINDGSNDKTEEVILSYQERFQTKGYSLTYFYQENAGPSAAINKGLEVFSGEYMTWIDSDDTIMPDAIERKVQFMEAHQDSGLCVCKGFVVDFETQVQIGIMKRVKPIGKDKFFYDLISGHNMFYTPAGFFVRTSMFRESMPVPLKIETPRVIGQNFQLLLPISFRYKVGYLDEFLFSYSVRRDSHSHTKQPFDKKMHSIDVADEVLRKVTSQFEASVEERSKIQKAIVAKVARSKMNALLQYGRKDYVDKYKHDLLSVDQYTFDDRLNYWSIKSKFVYLIVRVLKRIRKQF